MFRVLVLLAALAAGGVAAWLSLGMQGQTPTAAVAVAPQIQTQEVLVAAVDLPHGMALSDQELRWQSWPEEALNPAFITRSLRPDAVEDLSGSFVRQPMVVGEPIRQHSLADEHSGFLAARLASGKRAVAVRVSAETSAGGFILPNDRVDVIHTSGDDAGGRSRTILSNIRVLAIDQTASDSGADSVAVGKTATLELEPVQAEVISGAEASGSLSLALRATADNDEAPGLLRQRGQSVRIVRAGQSQTVRTDGAVE
jgi:pilus assembly protein CpaB